MMSVHAALVSERIYRQNVPGGMDTNAFLCLILLFSPFPLNALSLDADIAGLWAGCSQAQRV